MVGSIGEEISSVQDERVELIDGLRVRVTLAGKWSKKDHLQRAGQLFDLDLVGIDPPRMGQGPVTPVGHLITKEGSYGFIHVTADGCCKFEDYVGRSYYSLAPEFWSEIEISLPDQEPIRIISPAKVDAFYPS